MTREEIRLQVAISVIQGVLEAKHGVIGEVVPSVAVAIALRIADVFVEEWYHETKEQKSTDSEKRFESIDNAFKRGREVGFNEGVESVKQSVEWSEKEKLHLYNAIEAVKYVYDTSEGTNGFKCVEFLKSLCAYWKPSKGQIEALEYFIRSWGESGTMSPQNPILCTAKSLLKDLKQL